MTNRIHSLVLFTLLLSAPAFGSTAGTMPVDCQIAFSFLDDVEAPRTDVAGPRPADATPPPAAAPTEVAPANVWPTPPNATPKQLAALEKLKDLEKKTVSSVFPEIKQGDPVRVKISAENLKEFQRNFDEIWNERVKAGIIPKFEMRRYRKWLLTQNGANPNPYPAIDSSDLYGKFVAKNKPLAEFLDAKFLEFIEKEQGFNNFDVLPDYLATVDPSRGKYYMRAAWKGTKNFGRRFWVAMLLAPTTALTTGLISIPQQYLDKIVGSGKDAATNAVGGAIENVTNSIQGFASQDALEKAFDTVSVATEQLAKADFDKLYRSEGTSAILTVRKSYEAIMPEFKDFHEAREKDFDKNAAFDLKELSGHSRDARNYYEEARIRLAALERRIEQNAEKGQPETFEDTQRKLSLRGEMAEQEDFLSERIAEYLLYSATRGAKNPPDKVIRLQYENLLARYLESMSLPKLQKAWLEKVNGHMLKLKGFMPKFAEVKKNNAEKALEDKQAAETAKVAAEDEKAKAAAAAAAAKKAAEEKSAEEAAKKKKEADEAEAAARKAAEEAAKKAEEARKSEQKATEKPVAPAAAPAVETPKP